MGKACLKPNSLRPSGRSAFYLAALLLVSWLTLSESIWARGFPEVLEPGDINASPVLSIDSLAYYGGKLYVGSNKGLLEITNASLSKIYRWDKTGSAVTRPFHDAANGYLWVELDDEAKLAYYDGKTWRKTALPKPTHGYITRFDASESYRWVSGSNSIYYQGGGRGWAWKGSKWRELEYPPVKSNPQSPIGLLDRLIPTDKCIYFVMRDEHRPSFLFGLEEKVGVDRIAGNSIYYMA